MGLVEERIKPMQQLVRDSKANKGFSGWNSATRFLFSFLLFFFILFFYCFLWRILEGCEWLGM